MLFLFARAVQLGARSAMTVRHATSTSRSSSPGVGYVVMFLVFAYVDIAWDLRSTVFLGVAFALCADFAPAPRRPNRPTAGRARFEMVPPVSDAALGAGRRRPVRRGVRRAASGDDVAGAAMRAGGTTIVSSAPARAAVAGTPTTIASVGRRRRRACIVTIDASARRRRDQPADPRASRARSRAEEMREAGIQLNSWGGNPSTRYNYVIGHAWNHGADYEFRNTNYGDTGRLDRAGSSQANAAGGVASRVAVPTLGWVARNDDDGDVLVPRRDGGCLPATEVGNCADPKARRRPAARQRREHARTVSPTWIAGLARRRPRHPRSSPWTTSPSCGATPTTTSTPSARRTRRSSTST